MGLDMYLNRMPRYKNITPNQIRALEEYLTWKEQKENPESRARKYTLKDWCGVEFKDVPQGKAMEFYKPFFVTRYYFWDSEKRYPHKYIMEEVGYWRKAHKIHEWFVKHVQNGVDDCEYHHEVTKDILERLLKACNKALKKSEVCSDDTYHDIKDTIEIVKNVLETTDFEKQMIYYYSSW